MNLTNGGQISASTFGQGNAGGVNITATDTVTFDGENSQGFNSGAFSTVNSVDAVGDAGGVTISTGSLALINGGQISASTFGQGNAGAVNITATDTVTFDGENSQGFNSGAFSQVASVDAVGDAGGVTISTGSLALTNGGQISASTFGQGNGGGVIIDATESVFLDDGDIFSEVNSDAVGNAGTLEINTVELSLINNSIIGTRVFGDGDGGIAQINTDVLNVNSGARIDSSTSGNGNAGSVIINNTDLITLDGDNSFIQSEVNSGAEGDAGGVTINTGSLNVTNGGQISATTFGEGDAGTINVTATDTVTFDGEDSEGFNSGAFSNVNSDAVGDAGGVTIHTGSLAVTNGGQISASTFGQGNAGAVNITATDAITFDGEDSQGFSSGAFSTVDTNSIGDAGGVTISTSSLSLTNGAVINASTFGQGNAGSVNITATDKITFDGENSEGFNSGAFSTVDTNAVGDAGGVTISTGSLTLTNGGTVSVATSGQGNAGAVNITATDTVTIDGEDSEGFSSGVSSSVSSDAEGNAGNITINANSISLTNQGQIASDILGEGSGGNIILNVSDDLNLDNGQISATNQPPQPLDNPEDRIGGNIQLQVGNNLILRNNSTISAEATNNANGGNVNIGAGFIVGFPSEGTGSDIRANAGEGRGGNITINTQGVLGFEVSQGTVNLENDTNDIDASSQTTGLGGIIIINAPDVNPLQGVNRLPTNPVSADTIATDACSSTEGKTNLSIQGKGGIPPQAKEPLSADSLVPDGQPITVDEEADLNSSYNIPADIKPVKTDNGDIYPARGVIVKEDGTVILTAYPTDNKHNRVPQTAANCNS
ncbi:MAG: beta strand repeat-containing protein [Xenococcus sp. (in: cyanobacteria)]